MHFKVHLKLFSLCKTTTFRPFIKNANFAAFKIQLIVQFHSINLYMLHFEQLPAAQEQHE